VECEVQLRAHGEAVPAVVEVTAGRLVATLRHPVRGVASGQALVAYRPDAAGDVVLGSATIAGAMAGSAASDAARSVQGMKRPSHDGAAGGRR
jgi:hypothetical protein